MDALISEVRRFDMSAERDILLIADGANQTKRCYYIYRDFRQSDVSQASDPQIFNLFSQLIASIYFQKTTSFQRLLLGDENDDVDDDEDEDEEDESLFKINNDSYREPDGGLIALIQEKYGSDVVEYQRDSKPLSILLDNRLDPKNLLRAAIQNIQLPDDKLCIEDVEFRNGLSVPTIITHRLETPCFYPKQVLAADMIVRHIRFILEHYHQKKLEDFEDIEFRIYVPRSRMLRAQTMKRLRDPRTCCFEKTVYGDEKLLTQKVEKCVHMYSLQKTTVDDLKELERIASDEKRLLVIVADEAHWGTSNEGGANNTMVNKWTNAHKNVIVLQVTATPWNLLTANTRIPEQLVYDDGKTLRLAEQKQQRYDTNDDGKKLHILKWSEVFAASMKRGLLLTLRIPQKIQENCIWLTVGESFEWDEKTNTKWYPLVGRYDYKCSTALLFRSAIEGTVISTKDETKTLVVIQKQLGRNSGRRETKLVFIQSCDYKYLENVKHGYSICKTFNVVTFNESVIEISTTAQFLSSKNTCLVWKRSSDIKESSQEMYRNMCCDGVDPVEGCVVLADRPPANAVVEGIGLNYHKPEYTFLIERQCHVDQVEEKQYISLNFLFNSMRNKNQLCLIRDDENFIKLCDSVCKVLSRDRKKSQELTSDVLAAEYAYYILLMKVVRKISFDDLSHAHVFESRSHRIVEEKERLIKDMIEAIEKCSHENRPVNADVFKAVVQCIADEASQWCVRVMKQIGLSRNITVENATNFFAEIIKCIMLCEDCRSFCDKVREIETLVDADKLAAYYRMISGALSDAKTFWEKVIEVLCEKSETFRIVHSLIEESSSAGFRGSMKVVRVSDQASGNRFYMTLVFARRLSSEEDFYFEILRYFDKFELSKYNDMASVRRIWQLFQDRKCSYKYKLNHEICNCTDYEPGSTSIRCSNCHHEHVSIEHFSDLDGLPCIVIVVEKGRLGDTFPPSFSAMDLRIRSQNVAPHMSTLMQELGRLCRYQQMPDDGSYTGLPYALVGPQVIDLLKPYLLEGSVFYCAYQSGARIDAYVKRSKEKGMVAGKSHFDCGNTEKHQNRLLFMAEPQLGKTGVYLKVLSTLRGIILAEDDLAKKPAIGCHGDDDDEDEQELSSSSEDDDSEPDDTSSVTATVERSCGINFKHRICYPYWKDMEDAPALKQRMDGGKYSKLYGPYEYNKSPVYMPIKAVSHTEEKVKERLKVKDCFIDLPNTVGSQYRTYAAEHFNSNCSDCSMLSACAETYCFSLKSGQDLIKISIPLLRQFVPLLCKLPSLPNFSEADSYELSQSQKLELAQAACDGDVTLRTFIFHPTYGRPNKALLNYRHTMVTADGNKAASYVQVLVVRPEEFSAYASNWQSTHAIVEMPATLPINDVTSEAGNDVNVGGIGFARRFIQLLAELMDLERVFVIDDNVRRIYDRSKSLERSVRYIVPLFEVLRHLESQFECQLDVLSEYCDEFQPSKQMSNCDCFSREDGAGLPLHRYTGPNYSYGVVGLPKLRRGSFKRSQKAFAKTSVYSLVMLNVKAVKAKDIRYRLWQVREDCQFNNDCDVNGLYVCKYNQYVLHKLSLTPWMPSMYVWNDDSQLTAPSANLMKVSVEAAVNTLYRWIRQVAAPRRVSEIPSERVTRQHDVDDTFEVMLRQLRCSSASSKRTAHLAVFRQKLSTANLFDLSSSLKESCNLDEFSEHVIVVETPHCLDIGLTNVASFRELVVEKVFPSAVNVDVLTTHNVNHFCVPFVILFVRCSGNVENPKKRKSDSSSSSELEDNVVRDNKRNRLSADALEMDEAGPIQDRFEDAPEQQSTEGNGLQPDDVVGILHPIVSDPSEHEVADAVADKSSGANSEEPEMMQTDSTEQSAAVKPLNFLIGFKRHVRVYHDYIVIEDDGDTRKCAELNFQKWSKLVRAINEIDCAVEKVKEEQGVCHLLKHIGELWYVQVNILCVNIRQFNKVAGKDELWPTSTGIGLRLKEWPELKKAMEEIHKQRPDIAAVVPCYLQDDHNDQED